MNITRMAIEKKSVSIVALVVLIFAGINAYRVMPRAEDPGFIIRAAMVVTYFPGASAARVEDLVTDKIEEVVQQIPELDFVTSTSKPGVSIIVVNIQERYTDMRPIWDNLRRKVGGVAEDLPEGVSGPFVNDEFGDVFGTILMVTGDGYTWAELEEVADDVRKEILYLDEVGKVEILGVQEERIFIEYNNARLAELGISPSQLSTIIANRNIVIPGGSINTPEDRERINLEPTGNFESLQDLKHTVIELPGQSNLMYLEDVANIERATIDPPRAITRYSGQPALALAINMREGGNIIRLGEQVQELVTRLRQHYPIGLELDFVAFQARFVEKRVRDFSSNLLQAVFIVMLVMLVTLGVRTGLVVAGLIPVVMIVSLLIMNVLDIGLDQMSLASLIIALGLLVDNAIVMSESIMVLMAAGRKPLDAALQSAAELRIPLLTSSLTTAAAFLPIYLAESTTGEYTAPLFKVVTIALLTSWVLSLTLTPLCCVYLLKVKPRNMAETFGGWLYGGYRRILVLLLRRRFLTIAATVGLLFLAVFGLRFVPAIFFPPNDKPIFTVEVKLPVGTPIERTARVVQGIEQYMQQQTMISPERPRGVVDWVAFIGEGAPRFILSYNPEPAAPEYAFLLVNTTDYETMAPLMKDLREYITDHYPDVELTIDYLPLGAPVEAPVEVRLSGSESDRLFDLADAVKARMLETSGITTIDDDWGPRSKKLLVEINQARARRAGLTSRDVAISLQTVLSGFTTTEYREGDKVIPVILRSNAADRKDLGKLESHNIYVQSTGRSVPLKQVADTQVVWEAAKIHRRDRKQTITVQAWLDDSRTPIEVATELSSWLAKESADWGLGYQYAFGGEMESSVEANESISAKLPLAAMLIVLLLVAQFNSVRKPLIILLTIPLGLIGVTFGLLVARSYFGFMTLLGVISLAGIVINNAIVLLERIKLEIDENGLQPADAIVAAAQQRLRPILLTTSTTVGGLLPLWLGGGPMWEPMAIAIIFGLLFATVLTLGLVPVLYSVFFRVHVGGLSHS